MKAPLYNQDGEKKGDLSLAKHIFEAKPSEALAHMYLVYEQANGRMPIAHTLTKGDVRGGGKKPFQQKGTGRARQGSIRNPHYKGGGVAFGPKNVQNYEKMMSKRMRRQALFSILSVKAKDGQIIGLDKFEISNPSTKDFAKFMSAIKLERNLLVVLNRAEEILKKSARNIENAKVIQSGYLNPMDLMKYETVLFTETAMKDLNDTYKS